MSLEKQYPVGFESIFCERKSTHNVLVQVTGQCHCFLLYSKVTFFLSWFWANPLLWKRPSLQEELDLWRSLFASVSSCCMSAATPLQGSGRLQNVFYNYISASCSQSASHKNTCFFQAAASALSFEKGRCYWCFIFSLWELIRKETKHDFRLFPLMSVLFLVQKSKLKDFSTVAWIIPPNQATLSPFFFLHIPHL